MFMNNHYNFLQITIFFIIITFSEEFSIPTNLKETENLKEIQTKRHNERNTRSFQNQGNLEEPFYHRNDIGHLYEYYEERKKLNEQYNAIQNSLNDRYAQNITNKQIIDNGGIVTDEDGNSNSAEINSKNKKYVVGNCSGHVIYQQNIIIANSYYSMDIDLEGLTITCIVITSTNDESVTVTKLSGGPGKGRASLSLRGFDTSTNISLNMKIWGRNRF